MAHAAAPQKPDGQASTSSQGPYRVLPSVASISSPTGSSGSASAKLVAYEVSGSPPLTDPEARELPNMQADIHLTHTESELSPHLEDDGCPCRLHPPSDSALLFRHAPSAPLPIPRSPHRRNAAAAATEEGELEGCSGKVAYGFYSVIGVGIPRRALDLVRTTSLP